MKNIIIALLCMMAILAAALKIAIEFYGAHLPLYVAIFSGFISTFQVVANIIAGYWLRKLFEILEKEHGY
mgnify:CR=1 FL=1